MTLGRVFRFGVVGVFNTGTYYVWYLLLRLVTPYMVAHVLAFTLAMIGSYLLNCYVTFRTRPSWRTFLLFPLSNLANFVILTVGLPVAVQWGGLDERIAPLLVALVAVPITFLVAQWALTGSATTRDAEVRTPERVP